MVVNIYGLIIFIILWLYAAINIMKITFNLGIRIQDRIDNIIIEMVLKIFIIIIMVILISSPMIILKIILESI